MNDDLFTNVLGNLTTIGVRFDLDKVSNPMTCWRIFWECYDPSELCTSELFDGDTEATLHGRENVFCIAIRNLDSDLGDNIREALTHSQEFLDCAADPPFVDGPDCLRALQTAGRINALGELIGTDAAGVRAALGKVRIEKRQELFSAPKDAPSRFIPASERTAALPPLDCFDDVASKIFGWEGLLRAPFTPEELCDVVEHYAELLTVQVEEYSCPNSECMLLVSLYPSDDSEREGESFIGMYPFGSEMDAIDNCRSRMGDDVSPKELECLMEKRGILGKWHRNFETYGGATRESLDADKQVASAQLWAWLFHRADRMGMPIPTSQLRQAEIPPADTAAQRAERFMSAVAADEALGELARKDYQSATPGPIAKARYIRFSCDHCGKRLKARPQDVGKTGTCKSCGQRTTVREGSDPITILRFSCSTCDKTLKAPVSMSGTRAKCPNCRQPVQVPSGSTLESMSSRDKGRECSEGLEAILQELFAYLQSRGPAEIDNYEDSDCVRNRAKFLEALSDHSGSPCLTYYVMNGNAGKSATHKHLIVTTGEKAQFDRAWNYNTDEIRDQVLRDLSLPVGRWDKLTGDGCGSYANHSKPGCTLASTVPFDNLAKDILQGKYELTQVIRPAEDSGEEVGRDRWDVLILGDEVVCPDLACDICGDARVVPGYNGSHLRCCTCGTVYCKRNCQASIHGQCPRCGEADRIDGVELPQ